MRYFVRVTVQTNMDESAPVQFQSLVMCQAESNVTVGLVVSLELQNVAVTVSIPAVESEATGVPFMVDGSMVHVASKSDDCRDREDDSVNVKAPNVRACLAGDNVSESTS